LCLEFVTILFQWRASRGPLVGGDCQVIQDIIDASYIILIELSLLLLMVMMLLLLKLMLMLAPLPPLILHVAYDADVVAYVDVASVASVVDACY